MVEALERFPVLNASIEGDELVLHEDVNLGIAVALEDGLVVPVIRRAQRLSLEGLAADDRRARATRREPASSSPDDTHGGTFTITNPGQFGAILATPIINQPQVAILDVEAVVKRPVVVSGDDGSDAIAVRPMGYLCMSWDHRALDGAEAARFLADVRGRVEGSAAMSAGAFERVVVERGERSGCAVTVAVHSTRLGPALGGARMWHYARDAATRSPTPSDSPRAMTLKAAAAGLDLGGGKGVIAAPSRRGADAASSGARCCSTSATSSSRSTAAT